MPSAPGWTLGVVAVGAGGRPPTYAGPDRCAGGAVSPAAAALTPNSPAGAADSGQPARCDPPARQACRSSLQHAELMPGGEHLGAELSVGARADEQRSVTKQMTWYVRPRSMARDHARSAIDDPGRRWRQSVTP